MYVKSVLLSFLFCWSLVPAQAQSWPALKTTFGSLWDQPRTQAEAESSGWRLLGSCSDKFLGERYGHPDDNSIIIIFDVAGFIAGTQSVVPVDKVDSSLVDMTRMAAYQLDTWFDVPAYLTTVYFTDTDIICNGGRSQEQFDSEGTGDRLIVQVGPTATPDNLISVPLSKSEAGSDPAWFDHYCFIGMGDHFLQFNYQPDQDCHDVLPLQLLYDDGYDGILAGYVWQHVANLDGDRWEHPTHFAVDSIINSPPTCVNDYVDNPGLSTMHHYFWNYPLLILCPLRHDRSLAGYRKMMTSN